MRSGLSILNSETSSEEEPLNIGCRCIIDFLEAQTEGKSNSWYNRFRCLFCARKRKYLVSVPAPREMICLIWEDGDGDVGPFGGGGDKK